MAWTDILSATAAGLSAVAAGGALLAARRSNNTADSVASIERARRHIERTPQIDVALHEDRGLLRVYLSGPDELRELDSISVRIEDDDMEYVGPNFVQHVGGPTREQLERFVQGPIRFSHGADGADLDGRAVAPFALVVGKGRPLTIERQRPGSWMGSLTQEQWQRQQAQNPIRLRITCRLGDEEWVLNKSIDNPPFAATT